MFASRIVATWPQSLFYRGRNSCRISLDKQIHSRQSAAGRRRICILFSRSALPRFLVETQFALPFRKISPLSSRTRRRGRYADTFAEVKVIARTIQRIIFSRLLLISFPKRFSTVLLTFKKRRQKLQVAINCPRVVSKKRGEAQLRERKYNVNEHWLKLKY